MTKSQMEMRLSEAKLALDYALRNLGVALLDGSDSVNARKGVASCRQHIEDVEAMLMAWDDVAEAGAAAKDATAKVMGSMKNGPK